MPSGIPEGTAFSRYSWSMRGPPWLWLLTRSSDCKIFQRMAVPDILAQVFDDLGMNDYKLTLNGSYPELEYCVQYRESHYNFVTRLMEEAGIVGPFTGSKAREIFVPTVEELEKKFAAARQQPLGGQAGA